MSDRSVVIFLLLMVAPLSGLAGEPARVTNAYALKRFLPKPDSMLRSTIEPGFKWGYSRSASAQNNIEVKPIGVRIHQLRGLLALTDAKTSIRSIHYEVVYSESASRYFRYITGQVRKNNEKGMAESGVGFGEEGVVWTRYVPANPAVKNDQAQYQANLYVRQGPYVIGAYSICYKHNSAVKETSHFARQILRNAGVLSSDGTVGDEDRRHNHRQPLTDERTGGEKPDDEPWFIDVLASAPGYESKQQRLAVSGFEMSAVRVNGTVKDEQGAPLAGAVVTVDGEQAICDGLGRYSAQVQYVGGGGVLKRSATFALKAELGMVQARCIPQETLVADGSTRKVKLVLSSGGKAVAKRRLAIQYPSLFEGAGYPAGYIDPAVRPGCATWFETDEQGTAVIDLGMPSARKELPLLLNREKRERRMEQLFPVTASIGLRDITSNVTVQVPIRCESPFPRITRLAMPAVRAGKWQSSHSEMTWTNPRQEKQFTVQIRFRGSIRVARAGGHVEEWSIKSTVPGSALTFGLKPFAVGDDFADIPDFEKKLQDALLTNLAEYGTSRIGGILMDKASGTFNKAAGELTDRAGLYARQGKALAMRADGLTEVANAQLARGYSAAAKQTLNRARASMTRSGVFRGLAKNMKKRAGRYTWSGVEGLPGTGVISGDILDAFAGMGLEGWKARSAYDVEVEQGGITVPETTNTVMGLVDATTGLLDAIRGGG